MDLSVITVTWNNEEIISRQIKSVISGCKKISFEQFVVDNASKDETVKLVSKEFPGVKIIINEDNKGFGFANNQAAALSQGDFLLFLNPDMKVEEGSLDKIVEWIKNNPTVGIAGCKLINENGKFNEDAKPRRFPLAYEMAVMILKLPHIFPGILNRYLMKEFDPDIEQEVDSVRGAFILMRREVYDQLGWAFDPRYFFWFEDVDICRETKRLGYKVIYNPIITCVDYVGQSFKKRDTLWKQINFTASMVKYFRKWGKLYEWVPLYILRQFAIIFAWLTDKTKV